MNAVKLRLFYLASAALLACQSAFAGTQRQEQLSADVQASLHNSIINPIQPHLVFATSQEADAWLKDMSGRLKRWVPDDFLRRRLLIRLQYEAVRAGLDPQIVLSIITIESRFNKYAISNAGAEGIMQVMPFWLRQIGNSSQSLLNVDTNLRYGCTILRYYLRHENGNMQRALARYNGSLGQTRYADKVMVAYSKYWQPK